MNTLVEFFHFLTQRKKYWLWPLFIILVTLGLLLVAAHGAVLAPFIYSLF